MAAVTAAAPAVADAIITAAVAVAATTTAPTAQCIQRDPASTVSITAPPVGTMTAPIQQSMRSSGVIDLELEGGATVASTADDDGNDDVDNEIANAGLITLVPNAHPRPATAPSDVVSIAPASRTASTSAAAAAEWVSFFPYFGVFPPYFFSLYPAVTVSNTVIRPRDGDEDEPATKRAKPLPQEKYAIFSGRRRVRGCHVG